MKRIALWTCAVLLLVCLLLPTTDIVSPDWSVLVTDTAGHPIKDASVTVDSQQFTVESESVMDTKQTGDDGRVHFDERQISAMGITRLIGVIRNLDQGAHASFGVHTFLLTNKKGYGQPSEMALLTQNDIASRANGSERQSSHVVLIQCQPGYSGLGCTHPDDPGKPILPLKF
jgi:hypothetical protein